jgi:hypothetical protein
MKQAIHSIIFFFLFFPVLTSAQSDFKKGLIVTTNNEKLEGTIKESFRSKGVIIFLSAGGNKKTYSPSDIQSFSIDTISFISYSNDFYKEISSGTKARLYQKVTDNSGKMLYNGTEAVGYIKTTEGRPGDYYLLLAAKTELDLITKKSFEKYFIDLLNENETLLTKIKDGTLGYTQIAKLIELYNN